jgi:hypothetical protein
MIMDVAHHRLFKPPQITDIPPEYCCQCFMFYNKVIDAVNLSNILLHKKVQFRIPEYFMSKSTPAFPTHTLPLLHPNVLTTNKLCST